MGVCISATPNHAPSTRDVNKSSFVFKNAIGKGSFGFVWKAEKKPNRHPYAVKVMSKARIYNMRCVDTIINEMRLLSSLKHPFIVNMAYTFQEKDTLFMVTDYMVGGDLRYHINKNRKKFNERQT